MAQAINIVDGWIQTRDWNTYYGDTGPSWLPLHQVAAVGSMSGTYGGHPDAEAVVMVTDGNGFGFAVGWFDSTADAATAVTTIRDGVRDAIASLHGVVLP